MDLYPGNRLFSAAGTLEETGVSMSIEVFSLNVKQLDNKGFILNTDTIPTCISRTTRKMKCSLLRVFFFPFIFYFHPQVAGVTCKCRLVRTSRAVPTSVLFLLVSCEPPGRARTDSSSPVRKTLRGASGHTATACPLAGTAPPNLLPAAAPGKVKLAKQAWRVPRKELTPCLKIRDRHFIAILFAVGDTTEVLSFAPGSGILNFLTVTYTFLLS